MPKAMQPTYHTETKIRQINHKSMLLCNSLNNNATFQAKLPTSKQREVSTPDNQTTLASNQTTNGQTLTTRNVLITKIRTENFFLSKWTTKNIAQ